MKLWTLYLDDERFPPTDRDYTIARSVAEAWIAIADWGVPTFISFDHDLGEGEPTGHDFARMLVAKDLDMGGTYLPDGFDFKVHSANIIGGQNIERLLHNYLTWKLRQQ